MQRSCEQALLARGVVSEIMYCRNWGVFHVNVGAVTVHFDAPALHDLRDTLSAALVIHERITNTAEPAVPRPAVDVH